MLPRIEIEGDMHADLTHPDERQGAGLLDQLARRFSIWRSLSPRATNSRKRRMIWPARRACSAARSSASLTLGTASLWPESSRRRRP